MQPSDDSEADDLTRPATLAEHWEDVPGRTGDWQTGQRLGPFRLRHQLGRGGMGVVWLADQIEPLSREVAIKVLSPGARSRLAEAYFEVERQSLAQLSHHAIAQIFDAGRLPDGALFFAMEYVHAEPLDQFLQQHQLDFPSLAALLIEICAGVQHAHQRGLIHRDLKPGNILVREEDGIARPKIIDFGIAISAEVQADAERTAYLHAGTRAYMAPEQRHRDGGAIDVRTDVYALGVILAEMLLHCANVVPDSGGTGAGEAMREQLARGFSSRALTDHTGAGEPQAGVGPEVSLLKRIPRELRAIAVRAMANNPAHRYASAAAMADDLRHWLEKRPVEALNGGRMYLLRCFLRRNALATGAAAAIGLVLVVGIVVALYGLGEAREGRAQAEQARRLAEERRNDAEQLIQFMLGDFAAQLRPIGRLDLLDDIGAEAYRYLVGQNEALDASSALNRARALRTLGEVQTQRQEFDRAAETLAQAAKLVAPWEDKTSPRMAELHFESGQIAFWRGAVAYRQHDWASTEVYWQRYLRDAQVFAALTQDPRRAQSELAYAYNNLGTVAEARDRPEQALEYLTRSTSLRRGLVDDAGPAGVLALANNLSWIGRVQHALGKPAETWRSAVEALDLVVTERLDAPDHARLRQAEINFRINLARLSARLDLVEPAVEYLRRARALAEQDVENDPTQTRRQAQLATVAFLLARLPRVSEDEAREAFEQGQQALAVAASQGLAPRQGIELPALRQLAALRHGVSSQETTIEASRSTLKNVLDALQEHQDFDPDYFMLLELAAELIHALDRSGLAPAAGDIDILQNRLTDVPAAKRNNLRYYRARQVLLEARPSAAATSDELIRLRRTIEDIRKEVLTSWQVSP